MPATFIDAAPLVALSQLDEPRRTAILDALRTEPGALVIPAPVTAEIDYMPRLLAIKPGENRP